MSGSERDEKKIMGLVSASHGFTHGYMTLLPAVMGVIAGDHHLSFMAIGMIAGSGYFLYGLGSFPAGYLSDRYGSKRILTVGVGGMGISAILVGLSFGVISFALAFGLLGIFASIHHPAGLSLIARRVKSERGKAMGLHGVIGNIGLFLTPLYAALCMKFFGSWRAAYISFGLYGFLFATILHRTKIAEEPDFSFRVLLGRGRPPTPSAEANLAAAQLPSSGPKDAELPPATMIIPLALLFLYAGSILSGFIFRGSLTFLPALLKGEIHFITNHEEPVVMAGYLTSAILSIGLLGAWLGGNINDKVKYPELVPAGILFLTTPLLYALSRYSDSKLLVSGILFSLIYYGWQPSQNYLIAKYTRKATHGKGFGVAFFLLFGIGSIATTVGGYVTDSVGVDYFYRIMAYVSAAAAVTAALVWSSRHYQLRMPWQLEREERK